MLLNGHESGHGYQEAVLHVESCPNCQQRLEQLAAEATVWQEATSILSTTGGFAQGLPETNQKIPFQTPSTWSESMASRLLDPAHHPEMLGRIGRYDVERLIGSGGMGLVFKAFDTDLNRHVAVKLLAPYLSGIGTARKRFAREARAAAAVVDEHVVAIHNVESSDNANGASFLVMKYVAGGSLQQRIDQKGPLEVCEILRIGMQIAKGLAAAHAQGLIHRDVKPSNILLEEGVDRALLTDFGLAQTENDACLTRTGFQPGTPHYMSPEQVRGESIDARSDLFGMGCVLYAMCTGYPPFRAESSYSVMRRITDDQVRPVREINAKIPVWLEQIITKLLSKHREDRLDSAHNVAEILESCLAHLQEPVSQPLPDQVSKLLPSTQWTIPWPRYVGWAIGAVAVALAGILIVLELNKGTLRIECDTDDIPIRVIQGEKTVKELTVTKSGESVRIAAGQYKIELDGKFSDIEVDDDSVSLTRGDVRVVQIKKIEKESEVANPDQSSDANDQAGDNSPIKFAKRPPVLVPFGLNDLMDQDADRLSPAEQELAQIRKEHQQVSQAYSDALQSVADDTELNRIYTEMDPRVLMPQKYIAFEAKYRGTPSGLKALSIASNLAISGGDARTASGREEAIGRIIDHYLQVEGFAPGEFMFVIEGLSGGFPSSRTDELLEKIITKSPNLLTRCAAMVQRIRMDKMFLDAEPELNSIRQQIQDRIAAGPKDSGEIKQYQRLLTRLESTDFESLRKRVNRSLTRLSDYGDTPVQFYGTASNAASAISKSLNVVFGKPAPELEATDLDGKPFKLSDLKGKMVVLIFSQDKKFGELYAPIRQLVALYQSAPVRVVGVMGNNTGQELRAAREKNEITWRAIPESVNGPLFQSWGLEGYPYAFLIGADGILHGKIHLPYYGDGGRDTKEIRDKLDELLKNWYANKKGAK
ncbi:MAG: protein kinase [Planctomycetota bacterium]